MGAPTDLNAAREATLNALTARLRSYDADGALAPACATISRLIDGHCQAIADAFLERFLADPEVRASSGTMTDEARARQRRESAEYVRYKYAAPLSREWLSMALRNAARCHKAGVPIHAYLSGLSVGHSKVVEVIEAALGDDVATACQLADVIQRLAMVEAAVMAEHYAQRDEAKLRRERHAQASAFRESIGVTLDA